MSEKTKPQVTAADDDYSMEAVPELSLIHI